MEITARMLLVASCKTWVVRRLWPNLEVASWDSPLPWDLCRTQFTVRYLSKKSSKYRFLTQKPAKLLTSIYVVGRSSTLRSSKGSNIFSSLDFATKSSRRQPIREPNTASGPLTLPGSKWKYSKKNNQSCKSLHKMSETSVWRVFATTSAMVLSVTCLTTTLSGDCSRRNSTRLPRLPPSSGPMNKALLWCSTQ